MTVVVVASPYEAERLRRALASAGYGVAVAVAASEAAPLLDPASSAVVVSRRIADGDVRWLLGWAKDHGRPAVLLGETGGIDADGVPTLSRPVDPEALVRTMRAIAGRATTLPLPTVATPAEVPAVRTTAPLAALAAPSAAQALRTTTPLPRVTAALETTPARERQGAGSDEQAAPAPHARTKEWFGGEIEGDAAGAEAEPSAEAVVALVEESARLAATPPPVPARTPDLPAIEEWTDPLAGIDAAAPEPWSDDDALSSEIPLDRLALAALPAPETRDGGSINEAMSLPQEDDDALDSFESLDPLETGGTPPPTPANDTDAARAGAVEVAPPDARRPSGAVPIDGRRASGAIPIDARRPSGAVELPRPSGAIALDLLRGDLRDVDAAQLCGRIFRHGFTGRAVFRRGEVEKSVYFDQGFPVFAASNLPGDRLGDLLYREGKLSREEFARSAQVVAETGRRMGAILVDLGLLKSAELFPAVRRHYEDVLFSLFGWSEGSWALEPGAPPAGERIRLESHPIAIGLEGVRRKLGLDRLVDRVGPPSTVLRRAGAGDELDDQIGAAALSDGERRAWDLLDGSRSLADVARRAHVDDVELYAVAHALLAFGLLRRAADAPAESRVEVATIDRRRILARHALCREGDYFEVLGVAPDATSFEIRRAYESTAQAWSPSHLPAPLPVELSRELAEIGLVVAEAYEVLRDEARRRAYRDAIGR